MTTLFWLLILGGGLASVALARSNRWLLSGLVFGVFVAGPIIAAWWALAALGAGA